MKIKFVSNDDLSLGKILNIPVSVRIVKSVLQQNDKYSPPIYLHSCFYEYGHEYEYDSYSIV